MFVFTCFSRCFTAFEPIVCRSFVALQLVSCVSSSCSHCGMKAESLSAEGDQVTFLYNIRRVCSSFISTLLLGTDTEEERRRRSHSSKIKQQYFEKITWQHPRSRSSHTPSQKYQNTQVCLLSSCFVFISCRLVLRRDFVWFEGALALAVVLAPVPFHCCKGDNSTNKRGNFTSERPKKKRGMTEG